MQKILNCLFFAILFLSCSAGGEEQKGISLDQMNQGDAPLDSTGEANLRQVTTRPSTVLPASAMVQGFVADRLDGLHRQPAQRHRQRHRNQQRAEQAPNRHLWQGAWQADLPLPDYCGPVFNNLCASGHLINGVDFVDIDNQATGCGANNYSDFANLSTALYAGATHPITLTAGVGQDVYFAAMIDFNSDKDFDDAGEFF